MHTLICRERKYFTSQTTVEKLELRNGVGFPHNCDIQKCKLAVKILTNIDNEEWREENFEQSKYFCYRCHILRGNYKSYQFI
jgi:hypothetical protein